MLARLLEDGEFKVYAVTKEGTVATQRNWPRLLHEGNWGGLAGVLTNLVTSFAVLVLLITGVVIWSRRQLRRLGQRNRYRSQAPAKQPS